MLFASLDFNDKISFESDCAVTVLSVSDINRRPCGMYQALLLVDVFSVISGHTLVN